MGYLFSELKMVCVELTALPKKKKLQKYRRPVDIGVRGATVNHEHNFQN